MLSTLNKSEIIEQASQSYLSGDYARTIEILTTFLKSNPDEAEALHLRGTALARIGDFLAAESDFRAVVKIQPDRADAYFNLGLIYTHQGRLDEAIEKFEATLRLKPLDAQAMNDLGVLYCSKGKTDKAEELFAAALKINPAFKDAFLNIFEILWSRDKYNDALEIAHDYLLKLSATAAERKPEDKASIQVAPNRPAGNELTAPPITIRKHDRAEERLTEDERIELFSKRVPEQLRRKKTGMNIAVVADFNIAGQLTGIFRLINEKTIHRARCIIIQDDYLSYDNDLVLSRGKQEDYEEALRIIKNADFFHVGRFPIANDNFPLTDYLRSNNTIVQYFGSELRSNGWQIYNWHKGNRIVGLAAWDYTMIKDAPFFYHVNMMYDSAKVKRACPPEGTIRIAHPTTNRQIKKTELFLKAIDTLRRQGYDIEPVVIEGKTNQECLDLKASCQMTFDQISVGIYGVSAIESMAAGHVVFGGISNFAASYHPDNPIVWVTENNLVEKIKYYLDNKQEIPLRGKAGIEWVKKNHDPETILRQHLYLYDFVKNGHRFLQDPDDQLLRLT